MDTYYVAAIIVIFLVLMYYDYKEKNYEYVIEVVGLVLAGLTLWEIQKRRKMILKAVDSNDLSELRQHYKSN